MRSLTCLEDLPHWPVTQLYNTVSTHLKSTTTIFVKQWRKVMVVHGNIASPLFIPTKHCYVMSEKSMLSLYHCREDAKFISSKSSAQVRSPTVFKGVQTNNATRGYRGRRRVDILFSSQVCSLTWTYFRWSPGLIVSVGEEGRFWRLA